MLSRQSNTVSEELYQAKNTIRLGRGGGLDRMLIKMVGLLSSPDSTKSNKTKTPQPIGSQERRLLSHMECAPRVQASLCKIDRCCAHDNHQTLVHKFVPLG
mgnify:FL=1